MFRQKLVYILFLFQKLIYKYISQIIVNIHTLFTRPTFSFYYFRHDSHISKIHKKKLFLNDFVMHRAVREALFKSDAQKINTKNYVGWQIFVTLRILE